MLKLTLQQMKLSAGRLVAAGLAIMLGTAFVAATLAGTRAMENTAFNALSASYGDADLVIQTNWDDPSPTGVESAGQEIDRVQALDGVAAAEASSPQWWQLQAGQKTEMANFAALPHHPRLVVADLTEGALPSAPGEMTLGADIADRLGVSIGDTVTLTAHTWDDPDADEPAALTQDLTITGLLADSSSYFAGPPANYLDPADFAELETFTIGENEGMGSGAETVRLVVDPETSIDQVRKDLATIYPASWVNTPRELAEDTASELSGLSNPFTYVLLAFAAVALIVAALVISNTFQVLVAQRTRTLALLRCVGASQSQVKRSVRQEALILGFLASLVGLIIGVGLIQILLRVLAHYNPTLPIDYGLHLSGTTVLITLGIGMLVTFFAASSPARAATRVAPLAALRPLEATPVRGGGTFRKIMSVLLALIGLGLLGLGAYLGSGNTSLDNDSAVLLGLGTGILGGLISLVGLLLGSVFLVPAAIRLLGKLGGNSVPWKVSVENAVRNPRRTANTTNALVIGVALVMMFSTGAATARTTLDAMLDDEFPMDLTASTNTWNVQGDLTALTPAQLSALESTEGIQATTRVLAAEAQFTFPEASHEIPPGTEILHAADHLDQVLRSGSDLPTVADNELLISSSYQRGWELPTTGPVTVTVNGKSQELTYRVTSDSAVGVPMVSVDTLTELAGEPAIIGIYAKLDDGADAMDVVSSVQSTMVSLSEVDPTAPLVEFDGSAIMRQAFGQVIDILLLVVVALLAVAVIIALIGVANTLSLSVLERRRESAMLRAMGLTKGQLRTMLTFEGLFIPGVGAAIGIVAGLIYGWAGSTVLLGGFEQQVKLQVPWLELGVIVVVALVAGVLASIVPSRTATKPSPIEALATD